MPRLTGIDVVRVLIRQAFGLPTAALDPARHLHGALHFLMFPPGRVIAVRGVDEARSLPGVIDACVERVAGEAIDEVRDGRSRPGHLLVSGPTPADVQRTIARVRDLIDRLRTRVVEGGMKVLECTIRDGVRDDFQWSPRRSKASSASWPRPASVKSRSGTGRSGRIAHDTPARCCDEEMATVADAPSADRKSAPLHPQRRERRRFAAIPRQRRRLRPRRHRRVEERVGVSCDPGHLDGGRL
jgi:hypothetical protein